MAYIKSLQKSAATLIPGPQDSFKRMVRVTVRNWKRRQKRNEMLCLLDKPDFILKDMGITRGDVIEALSSSGNPALHLHALAARRRFWQRSADRF